MSDEALAAAFTRSARVYEDSGRKWFGIITVWSIEGVWACMPATLNNSEVFGDSGATEASSVDMVEVRNEFAAKLARVAAGIKDR